ncbi:hypothetical protein AG1IA_05900 [Rhizoctonia solani AG-1 IA]|uniref:Uncharacterized protein n=1 Tax=Thanatephorus cucumeris (strain AG1-IA) TaxID=983506 RepID=L8WTE8_THACA|nr:hypothetical protein AG1IA_05900 [Rhizoctonia solani AG-1 IA]
MQDSSDERNRVRDAPGWVHSSLVILGNGQWSVGALHRQLADHRLGIGSWFGWIHGDKECAVTIIYGNLKRDGNVAISGGFNQIHFGPLVSVASLILEWSIWRIVVCEVEWENFDYCVVDSSVTTCKVWLRLWWTIRPCRWLALLDQVSYPPTVLWFLAWLRTCGAQFMRLGTGRIDRRIGRRIGRQISRQAHGRVREIRLGVQRLLSDGPFCKSSARVQ